MNERQLRAAESELWNWSWWCWQGESPIPATPTRCYSLEREYQAPDYEAERGEEYSRSPDEMCANLPDWEPRRVNADRARKVQEVYDRLPLIEQRIVQAEFPRRHEYGGLNGKEREIAASKRLGIPQEYYKIALNAMKAKVWKVLG